MEGYGYKIDLKTTVGEVAGASLPEEFETNDLLVSFEFDAPDDSGARLVRDAIMFTVHDASGDGIVPMLSRRSKTVIDGIPQWDKVETHEAATA